MDIYILKISTSTQANQSPNKRFSRLQLRRRETKDQEAVKLILCPGFKIIDYLKFTDYDTS